MIFSEKYEKLFDIAKYQNIRYVVLIGGRASGKSTAVSHFSHDISFEKDHVLLNTRFTMASAKDSVIAEMEKTISDRSSEELFENANNTLLNTVSGAKIIFKGLQSSSLTQTAKLKSTTNLNIWILDEAEELHNESIFDDVDDSIRREGYHNLIILVLNSHHVTKEHFIYKRFFEDANVNWGFNGVKNDVLYIHTTFLDNWVNLSQSYKDKIKKTKKLYPNKYKYNFKGELRSKAEGVIFENWSFGEFDNTLPFGFGLDFGVADPDAFIKVAINEKLKKMYLSLKIYKSDNSTNDLIKQIKKNAKRNDLIVADSAGKRIIKDLKTQGFNIRKSKKGKGSVISGIKKMLNYEIIVDNNKLSNKLAEELNNYVWLDKKGEVPIDAFNHSLDAVRYILGELTSKNIWSYN